MGQEKIENVQALRGIASLMVVFYHVGLYERGIFGKFALFEPITASWNSGIDLFFVISGFVMVRISTHRFHKPGDSRIFFLRRAARIFPLYWFYTLVCLGFFAWRPGFIINPAGIFGGSLLRSFLLIPDNSQPLLFQGWTLSHELYFYLVFALTLRAREPGRMTILGLWGVSIVAMLLLAPRLAKASPVLDVMTSPLTLEFLAGCGVAWVIGRGFYSYAVPAIICAAGAFVAASFLSQPGLHVFFYIVPATLLVYGAVTAECRHRFRFPEWLMRIGDSSYSLYLAHTIAFSLVLHLWLSIHVSGGIGADLIFTVVSVAFCVLAGLASYRWIEKPLLVIGYEIVSKLTSSGRLKPVEVSGVTESAPPVPEPGRANLAKPKWPVPPL